MYRDYLCSEEKKRELIEADKRELIQYEKELREKYNPNNIFKNNSNREEIKPITDLTIKQEKESLFQKIIDYIKNFLK